MPSHPFDRHEVHAAVQQVPDERAPTVVRAESRHPGVGRPPTHDAVDGLIRESVLHHPATLVHWPVSLGVLTAPWQLAVLMLAVVLLTVQAFVINRLAGIPYPLWSAPAAPVAGGR